jgi:hypothetical protein
MKNWMLFTLVLLTLCGVGCSAEAAAGVETAVSTSIDASSRLLADGNDALPVITQLAAGTLQLEGTDLAVDETSAAELLPLWQAAQSLQNSDTTAAVEVDAVVNQIQHAMDPAQITAIAEMALTEDILGELLESGAVTLGPGDGRARDTTDGETAVRPGGGPGAGLGGGRPEGGLGAPGGVAISEDDIATRQAEMASDGVSETMWVGAVVRLLQSKTGEGLERPGAGVMEVVMTAVAATLDISSEELQAEMMERGTLTAVIVAHEAEVEAVRAAIITAVEGLPNAGDLDAQQVADSWLSE